MLLRYETRYLRGLEKPSHQATLVRIHFHRGDRLRTASSLSTCWNTLYLLRKQTIDGSVLGSTEASSTRTTLTYSLQANAHRTISGILDVRAIQKPAGTRIVIDFSRALSPTDTSYTYKYSTLCKIGACTSCGTPHYLCKCVRLVLIPFSAENSPEIACSPHIPIFMDKNLTEHWCVCEPRVEKEGISYPLMAPDGSACQPGCRGNWRKGTGIV